jgi:hypothetical protein
MRTFLCIALLQVAGYAADASLLSLVMPDAKVIAGLHVDRAKNSPFGMYVLAHMQLDDPDFLKFIAATGFDPRRDVTEIVIAANGLTYDPSRWLVLAKGTFLPAKIGEVAEANGGSTVNYHGFNILAGATNEKNISSAIVFLDSSTAVLGELDGVEGAIDRRKSGGGGGSVLARKVRQVGANNDFWFTTLVPLSEFASAMPDPNLSSAMKGNLLGAVQQASGGIKFGQTVQLSAEAITRSPKDASALVDVVKFVAGLIQTNRQGDKTAAQVSTLLDGLQTSAQGNTMTMTLAIPEATLEQMLSMMRQDRSKKSIPSPSVPK